VHIVQGALKKGYKVSRMYFANLFMNIFRSLWKKARCILCKTLSCSWYKL